MVGTKRKEKKIHVARNWEICKGVMRYSKSGMFHKKGLFAKPKSEAKTKAPKSGVEKIVKPIGGEKNGQTREVLKRKWPRHYPTQDKPKIMKKPMKPFSRHPRKLRTSITPGSLFIMLAGPHKGKRVIFLKQLESGLLLVTGPHKINGCPLRRVNQKYVIATNTKLDIGNIQIPDKIKDDYFKKPQINKNKKQDEDIFETEKEVKEFPQEKKDHQKVVDDQIFDLIKSHKDCHYLKKYLSTTFSLKANQYPHNMIF